MKTITLVCQKPPLFVEILITNVTVFFSIIPEEGRSVKFRPIVCTVPAMFPVTATWTRWFPEILRMPPTFQVCTLLTTWGWNNQVNRTSRSAVPMQGFHKLQFSRPHPGNNIRRNTLPEFWKQDEGISKSSKTSGLRHLISHSSSHS